MGCFAPYCASLGAYASLSWGSTGRGRSEASLLRLVLLLLPIGPHLWGHHPPGPVVSASVALPSWVKFAQLENTNPFLANCSRPSPRGQWVFEAEAPSCRLRAAPVLIQEETCPGYFPRLRPSSSLLFLLLSRLSAVVSGSAPALHTWWKRAEIGLGVRPIEGLLEPGAMYSGLSTLASIASAWSSSMSASSSGL